MAGTMKVKATGSRAEVMHGTAKHTAGGLKKGDLMMRKGRIVSKKASAAGKKAILRLKKLGFVAKKGTFKLFRKSDSKKMMKKGKKGSRKMRGGNFFEEMSGSSGSQ